MVDEHVVDFYENIRLPSTWHVEDWGDEGEGDGVGVFAGSAFLLHLLLLPTVLLHRHLLFSFF